MPDTSSDSGEVSIDFICGFAIFMLALIWVLTLIPGLLVGLQGFTVDYDAVAYRTGVILVEDPGETTSVNFTEPWESLPPDDVARFGLAVSRDSPNVLSEVKIARFFDNTTFDTQDYRTKALFGDYPYHFNISVHDTERNEIRSTGEPLPEGYGYIRRLAKIKGSSNVTLDEASILNDEFVNNDVDRLNATYHMFSILINTSRLYTEVRDPAYQIDPVHQPLMINITDLSKNTIKSNASAQVRLTSIKANDISNPDINITIDGAYPTLPAAVNDKINITVSPLVFQNLYSGIYDPALYWPVYVNLTFEVNNGNSTYLNNTWANPQSPFEYNYDPANVTAPQLRDSVMEVAIW